MRLNLTTYKVHCTVVIYTKLKRRHYILTPFPHYPSALCVYFIYTHSKCYSKDFFAFAATMNAQYHIIYSCVASAYKVRLEMHTYVLEYTTQSAAQRPLREREKHFIRISGAFMKQWRA
jgi:hypothetical protein